MTDQLDPAKYHVLSPRGQKKALFLAVFIVFIVLPFLGIKYYQLAINRPSQTDKELTIEIKKGDGVFEIADNLYSKDAINSKFLFILYIFANRAERTIQAGTYTIKAGTSTVNLVEQIKHGTNDVKLIFYEGMRVEQYARLIEGKLSNVSYDKFVEAAKPYEGYLFPDTYYFNKDAGEEDVITEGGFN
jgi:UPF0755 protein